MLLTVWGPVWGLVSARTWENSILFNNSPGIIPSSDNYSSDWYLDTEFFASGCNFKVDLSKSHLYHLIFNLLHEKKKKKKKQYCTMLYIHNNYSPNWHLSYDLGKEPEIKILCSEFFFIIFSWIFWFGETMFQITWKEDACTAYVLCEPRYAFVRLVIVGAIGGSFIKVS